MAVISTVNDAAVAGSAIKSSMLELNGNRRAVRRCPAVNDAVPVLDVDMSTVGALYVVGEGMVIVDDTLAYTSSMYNRAIIVEGPAVRLVVAMLSRGALTVPLVPNTMGYVS